MLFFSKIISKIVKLKGWAIVLFTVMFVFSNAVIMTLIEPQTFDNIFHTAWWILTTMTTVGYGDVSPTTTLGRAWTMLFIFTFGIGLFGMFVGFVVDAFSKYKQMKEEGKLEYEGKGHYVIIGWTQKSKLTVKELMICDPQVEIVLIDELERTPFDAPSFHYIQGSPTEFDTLKKAKIEDAKAVLIFSPANVDHPDLADGKTLLIASSIESYDDGTEKSIYTIAEIMNERHVQSFKHAKIDEFILSQQSVSYLMAKSARNKGASHIFTQLLSQQEGYNDSDLWEVPKKHGWTTYQDAYEALKSEGAMLIADGKSLNILQMLNKHIPDNAQLFVICNQSTYEKIMQRYS